MLNNLVPQPRKWHPRAGHITFRPFRTGLARLNVLSAGGRALQRAVTKAQGSLVYAIAASPTFWSYGPDVLLCGRQD
jgi:hypothetical protein